MVFRFHLGLCLCFCLCVFGRLFGAEAMVDGQLTVYVLTWDPVCERKEGDR